MAVAIRVASSSWTELTADGAVTIPSTPSTGDRVFLFAAWKTYSITATVSDWTEITEWADGTSDSGNGTGSVKVACWYKDYTGAGNPTIDFSASPTNAQAAILVMQPGAGEQWLTPGYVTAALSWGTGSTTTSASSTIDVPTGGVVMAICGIRDDTSTFTRGVNGLDAVSGVTFNTYVEAPETHASSTTGNDLSADLGYRLVTSGGTGITLRVTGTLSATETGAALWVVQGVQVATSATQQNPATITGAAYGVTAKVEPRNLGAGAATGAAYQATGQPGKPAPAGLPAGTVAAYGTTTKVVANAGLAAATGAAATPTDKVTPPSVGTSATGSALDATAETEAGVINFTCQAAATGTATALAINANLKASAGYARGRSA